MKHLCGILLLFLFYVDSVAAQEPIKIGYPSTSYTTLPIVAALRNGFFAQEGLRVELIRMAPNISIIALVNNQVEFVTVQGSIIRGAARGLPIKSVAVIADRPVYYLVAREAVTSINALKGKTIGLNSLGGSAHLMTKELLAHYRLDPDKDVTMIVSGDHKSSIESVHVGQIDATVVPVPWQVVSKKAGLKVVAYYGDVLRMPLGGLGASDEFIQKRGDTLKRVLRGTLKGIGFLRQKEKKSEVVKLMVDWFNVDRETAADSYDQIILAYPPDGRTSAEVLEKDLEISRQLGAIKGTVPLSRVVNFKMLDEVARELGAK